MKVKNSGPGLKNNIDFDELNSILTEDIDSGDISQSDESRGIRESIDFLENEKKSYIQVDEEFGKFLTNYVNIQYKKEMQKIHFKEQFFWFVMIGFFALMLAPLILVISIKELSDITLIIAFLSVLIEVVSAIIVLPKIIAKYLFNLQEDQYMIQIIQSMQKYNEKKHIHIDKK